MAAYSVKIGQENAAMQAKAALRGIYLQKRLMQDKKAALTRSRLAQAHILASRQWQKARTVALYMASRGECACDMLLQNAWKTGRQALLPKILDRQAGIMEFAPCENGNELRSGPFGIAEPLAAADPGASPEMIVVPGLAFTPQGARLGFGGGYYDRYLARHPESHGPLVGLCYAFQIVDFLPADPWDVPMNAICAETGLIWL